MRVSVVIRAQANTKTLYCIGRVCMCIGSKY